jgi:hypothetical protein
MVSGFLFHYVDLHRFIILNCNENLMDRKCHSSPTDIKNLNNYTTLCLHKAPGNPGFWQRPKDTDKIWQRNQWGFSVVQFTKDSNVACNIGQETSILSLKISETWH